MHATLHGGEQRGPTGMVGSDSLLLLARELGCVGAVLGSSNFLARESVALYAGLQAGNAGAAAERWARPDPLMQQLDVAEVYVRRVKVAMGPIGRDAGRPIAPIAPLDPPDVAMLRAALDDLDLLALRSGVGETLISESSVRA